MQRYLLKILNAKPEEAEQVLLLLAKGFCMGIFLAAFEVTSSTLFLNHFDEQKDLPLAFIVSGMAIESASSGQRSCASFGPEPLISNAIGSPTVIVSGSRETRNESSLDGVHAP